MAGGEVLKVQLSRYRDDSNDTEQDLPRLPVTWVPQRDASRTPQHTQALIRSQLICSFIPARNAKKTKTGESK